MAGKQHIHTRAVSAANDDITKVIESLKEGPKFMQETVSPRTQARRDAIENAPEEVKALLQQGYTQEFVHRLARLMGSE